MILQHVVVALVLIACVVLVFRYSVISSCPEYYKRMPKPEPGKFIAGYAVTTVFGGYREMDVGEYSCRRKAYKAARLAAYSYDVRHPCSEIGVDWYVKGIRDESKV